MGLASDRHFYSQKEKSEKKEEITGPKQVLNLAGQILLDFKAGELSSLA